MNPPIISCSARSGILNSADNSGVHPYRAIARGKRAYLRWRADVRECGRTLSLRRIGRCADLAECASGLPHTSRLWRLSRLLTSTRQSTREVRLQEQSLVRVSGAGRAPLTLWTLLSRGRMKRKPRPKGVVQLPEPRRCVPVLCGKKERPLSCEFR